jgi:hypothetical protein
MPFELVYAMETTKEVSDTNYEPARKLISKVVLGGHQNVH